MFLLSQFWSDVAGQQTYPYFSGPDKIYQSSIQSDKSVESYRVYDLLQTDRHFRKNRFFSLIGSQNVKIL